MDPDKDPGEPWLLGKARIVKPGAKKKDEAVPEEVDVNLILRRMPVEMVSEFEEIWKVPRTLRDLAGNEREVKEWDHGPRLLRFGTEQALWMWLDTENLVVSIGDDQALALYIKAHEDSSKPIPKNLKKDGSVLIDGILTDDVKRHLLDRFPRVKSLILEAGRKYNTLEAEGEAKLRKNS